MSDAFSAIITTAALVLPETSVGLIEASTTQALDAHNAQAGVDDRLGVRTHAAAAGKVEDGGSRRSNEN
jgi:hypothetical protein